MRKHIMAAAAAAFLLGGLIFCSDLPPVTDVSAVEQQAGDQSISQTEVQKQTEITLVFDGDGNLINPEALEQLEGAEKIEYVTEQEGRRSTQTRPQVQITPETGYFVDVYEDSDYQLERDFLWEKEEPPMTVLTWEALKETPDTSEGHQLTLIMGSDSLSPQLRDFTGSQPDDGSWTLEGYSVSFAADDGDKQSGASGIAKVTYSKSPGVSEGAPADDETELTPDEETGLYELVIPDESYEGAYYITAYDWAGNFAQQQIAVRVDTGAPVLGQPESEPALNTGADGIGWINGSTKISVDVGSPVSGIDSVWYSTAEDGSDAVEIQADQGGIYSFDTPGQAGRETYYIWAESGAGVVSQKQVLTVGTDLKKPTVDSAEGSGDGWLSFKKNITLSISVSDNAEDEGSADAVSGVARVYVETVLTGSGDVESRLDATRNDDGTYTFKIERGWFNSSVKNKVFKIYAVDAAGNVSAAYNYSVNVDVEEPEIEAIEITGVDGEALRNYDTLENQAFADGQIKVTVQASDDENGSGVDTIGLYKKRGLLGYEELAAPVEVDDNNEAIFYIPAGELAEDDEVAFEGAIYAMAADRAGNESDYTAFGTGRNDNAPDTVVAENTDPDISIIEEDKADTTVETDGIEYSCYKDDTSLKIQVSDEAGQVNSGVQRLRVTVNGQEISDQSFDSRIGNKELTINTEDCAMAEDGAYDVTVEAWDFSGNKIAGSHRIYKDGVAPRITNIEKSPASEWSSDDVTVTVTASDEFGPCDSGVAAVWYGKSDDFEQAIRAENTGDGVYSFTVTEEADRIYYLWAEDRAGNVSALGDDTQVSVKIDRTVPVITSLEYDGPGHRDDEDGSLTGIVEETDYGYYFHDDVMVTVTGRDTQTQTEDGGVQEVDGSGVAQIYYQLVPADGSAPSPATVLAADEAGSISFRIEKGFKGDIYVKASDKAGNMPADDETTPLTDEGYVHGSGVILEKQEEHDETAQVTVDLPETSFEDEQGQPLFGEAIDVSVDIADSVSGIRTIQWEIDAPHDEGGAGTVEIDNSGEPTGDTGGWEVLSTEKNLVTRAAADIPVKADSNDITLTVRLTDRAGNTTTEKVTFSIDRTAPVIEVDYDNDSYDEDFLHETEYYNADRTATIDIRERNFDAGEVNITVTRDGETVRLDELQWEYVPDEEDPDMSIHRTQLTFDRDGDYTVLVTAGDKAGHQAQPYGEEKFTIDKTAPVLSIEFDNDDGENGGYFDSGRTGTITVREHNFETTRFQLTGEASLAGADIAYPELSDWESSGDVHTTTIRFTDEGDYTLRISYTDKAGNASQRQIDEEFTIDMTAPELSIGNIEENSANAGAVRPSVSWSDINLEGPAEITLTGSNQGETSMPGESSDSEAEGSFRYDNFPVEKESDDVYTLKAVVADLAGNETEKSLTFSVNRFGSVYTFTPSLAETDGRFFDKEQDIVIHETNVDTLDPETIDIKVARNGQNADMEDVSYQISNDSANGSWSQYSYRLTADNFSEEGVYVVSVNSVDEAGNVNDSTDETKEAELRFGIDKSDPLIMAVNVEEGTTYPEDSKKAEFAIEDNLLLKDVTVTVNGREIETEADGELYSFTLTGSDKAREIVVEAVDEAGNTSSLILPDVYVTRNLFVRWYTNTPLMLGSIGALCAAAAAVTLLIWRKKRRGREAAEAEEEGATDI